ncbi:hypothetical protein [Hymenobacter sp. BRD67]|uniref:hypothetical protein n=1 Tax=Hymenobacter sp. BRD67 TaxID=2675877 RepID=UPI0015656B24|nr:hypothetical protein [Hymenobacter sp. BRD67]QKG51963.1 hypothetical protein GKZ67_04235 [Hymenobacter sp. BRD67]
MSTTGSSIRVAYRSRSAAPVAVEANATVGFVTLTTNARGLKFLASVGGQYLASRNWRDIDYWDAGVDALLNGNPALEGAVDFKPGNYNSDEPILSVVGRNKAVGKAVGETAAYYVGGKLMGTEGAKAVFGEGAATEFMKSTLINAAGNDWGNAGGIFVPYNAEKH